MTTLLVDVDGVLQFPNPSFPATIESDYRWRGTYEAFLADLFEDPAYLTALVGRTPITVVLDEVLARHVQDLSGQVFLRRWLTGNVVTNANLLRLLAQAQVDAVYLASNQEPCRGEYICGLYGHHPWLTGALFSHQLGQRKPCPEYFHLLLEQLACPPGDCVFVDDSVACVAAARRVGIPSVRYTITDDLRRWFAAHGIGLGDDQGPEESAPSENPGVLPPGRSCPA